MGTFFPHTVSSIFCLSLTHTHTRTYTHTHTHTHTRTYTHTHTHTRTRTLPASARRGDCNAFWQVHSVVSLSLKLHHAHFLASPRCCVPIPQTPSRPLSGKSTVLCPYPSNSITPTFWQVHGVVSLSLKLHHAHFLASPQCCVPIPQTPSRPLSGKSTVLCPYPSNSITPTFWQVHSVVSLSLKLHHAHFLASPQCCVPIPQTPSRPLSGKSTVLCPYPSNSITPTFWQVHSVVSLSLKLHHAHFLASPRCCVPIPQTPSRPLSGKSTVLCPYPSNSITPTFWQVHSVVSLSLKLHHAHFLASPQCCVPIPQTPSRPFSGKSTVLCPYPSNSITPTFWQVHSVVSLSLKLHHAHFLASPQCCVPIPQTPSRPLSGKSTVLCPYPSNSITPTFWQVHSVVSLSLKLHHAHFLASPQCCVPIPQTPSRPLSGKSTVLCPYPSNSITPTFWQVHSVVSLSLKLHHAHFLASPQCCVPIPQTPSRPLSGKSTVLCPYPSNSITPTFWQVHGVVSLSLKLHHAHFLASPQCCVPIPQTPSRPLSGKSTVLCPYPSNSITPTFWQVHGVVSLSLKLHHAHFLASPRCCVPIPQTPSRPLSGKSTVLCPYPSNSITPTFWQVHSVVSLSLKLHHAHFLASPRCCVPIPQTPSRPLSGKSTVLCPYPSNSITPTFWQVHGVVSLSLKLHHAHFLASQQCCVPIPQTPSRPLSGKSTVLCPYPSNSITPTFWQVHGVVSLSLKLHHAHFLASPRCCVPIPQTPSRPLSGKSTVLCPYPSNSITPTFWQVHSVVSLSLKLHHAHFLASPQCCVPIPQTPSRPLSGKSTVLCPYPSNSITPTFWQVHGVVSLSLKLHHAHFLASPQCCVPIPQTPSRPLSGKSTVLCPYPSNSITPTFWQVHSVVSLSLKLHHAHFLASPQCCVPVPQTPSRPLSGKSTVLCPYPSNSITPTFWQVHGVVSLSLKLHHAHFLASPRCCVPIPQTPSRPLSGKSTVLCPYPSNSITPTFWQVHGVVSLSLKLHHAHFLASPRCCVPIPQTPSRPLSGKSTVLCPYPSNSITPTFWQVHCVVSLSLKLHHAHFLASPLRCVPIIAQNASHFTAKRASSAFVTNVGKYQNGTSYTRVSARHNRDARALLWVSWSVSRKDSERKMF